MNLKRIRQLNSGTSSPAGKHSPVVYWMSREQRVHDNWALNFAQEIALQSKSPLFVIFSLTSDFLNASNYQYLFMLENLKKVELELKKYSIQFILIHGDPIKTLAKYLNNIGPKVLVTDFDPLKIKKIWKNTILKSINIPFFEVDSHNIVPCWVASEKQEYAAYTLRPKINKLLPDFLDEFPRVKNNPFNSSLSTSGTDWEKVFRSIKINMRAPWLKWIEPGEKNSLNMLKKFIKNKIELYPDHKNDPNSSCLSNFSPYLHFGQISAQRIAIEISKSEISEKAKEVFLEELIIRKELADNFCFYNQNYDNVNGFPKWAKESFKRHAKDKREYIYSLEQFENSDTHDFLWNAAQNEMVKTGKMHGYLRMYWAKKILEWTKTPEQALEISIYLNNKYELDGRDPNGYTGIAWSIGGVHDRPWFNKNVFGMVRYMNYNGCAKKFNVEEYIDRIKNL